MITIIVAVVSLIAGVILGAKLKAASIKAVIAKAEAAVKAEAVKVEGVVKSDADKILADIKAKL